MKKNLIILLIFSVVGLLALIFTLPSSRQPARTATATIFPLYDIAQNIAGDKFQIKLIVPSGASPHTFELSPREAAAIEDSEVLFAIGGIDDWIIHANNGTSVYTVNSGIDLLTITDEHHEMDYDDELDDHHVGNSDPHYWLDVQNGIKIAASITGQLQKIDPENSDYYQNRYLAYRSELEQLDEELLSDLSQIDQNEIATFHHSFAYFAQRYGLEITATFEEFPGKEPSPQYLTEFSDSLESGAVKAVFSEPQLPISQVERIASEYSIPLGVLDPIGGAPGRSSYIEMMRYNKSELIKTLNLK